jgi:hypothetical protein
LRPGPRLCQTACLSLSHGSCPPGSIDLQIRRFPYGHPAPFRSVRDLGVVPGRLSVPVRTSKELFIRVAPSVAPRLAPTVRFSGRTYPELLRIV